MQNECPICKSVKSTRLSVHSSDSYSCIIHKGTGMVYLQVCLNCGAVYVDKNTLEKIRRNEGISIA